MTSSPPSAAGGSPDATWTTGEAAAYLNAGGVDFGFTARKVRQLTSHPHTLIRVIRVHRWRRLVVSTVRAERARLLAEIGRVDPDWPGPPAA
jgi:hypothetical protein